MNGHRMPEVDFLSVVQIQDSARRAKWTQRRQPSAEDGVHSAQMMRRAVIMSGVGAAVALVLAGCGDPGSPDGAITDLAPAAGEMTGWEPRGGAQIFEGEELFELINGGAEIYHEFGFERALSSDYSNGANGLVALEIFEMEDADAAYGVYAIKSGTTGEAIELGDEAVLEAYYLNLRKDRFVVTLTAMDTSEDTLRGLEAIAAEVSEKIPGGSRPPAVVSEMTMGDQMPERLFYVRGGLALVSAAPFAAGLGPMMAEGAAARFDDRTEVMLRYPDPAIAGQRFDLIIAELDGRADLDLVEKVDGKSARLEGADGSALRLSLTGDSIWLVQEHGATGGGP